MSVEAESIVKQIDENRTATFAYRTILRRSVLLCTGVTYYGGQARLNYEAAETGRAVTPKELTILALRGAGCTTNTVSELTENPLTTVSSFIGRALPKIDCDSKKPATLLPILLARGLVTVTDPSQYFTFMGQEQNILERVAMGESDAFIAAAIRVPIRDVRDSIAAFRKRYDLHTVAEQAAATVFSNPSIFSGPSDLGRINAP